MMHWCLLRAHAESEGSYDEMISSITKKLEEGKESLWHDHTRVTEILQGTDSVTPNENFDPQQQPQEQVQKIPVKSPSQPMQGNGDIIHIEIVGGEYQGRTYNLQPTRKGFCAVGRSSGKRIRETGISLPKDLEVSTSHGKFQRLGSRFVYVDTGSTNGSRIGDMDIQPNEPLELQTGMEIIVGQTIMKVSVPY